jgi:hypothetical protein
MDVKETAAILRIIKLSYPESFKGMSGADAGETIDLWAMMFADDDAKIVTEAVKAMITTLKYPPKIADVKEKIQLITQQPTLTELEAWNIVYRAICNGSYYADEYFNNFPPILKKLVGEPKQIREWAQMEGDAVKSVIQSNFMRSYTARLKKDTELNALPESTKNMICEISERFKPLEIGGVK